MICRNVTACLPAELLTMILQTQSHADVFRAAQVSRRWRNAANACDEFYMPLNLNLTIDTLMVLPRDLGDIAECASRIMSSTPVPIQLRIKITTIPSTIPPNSANSTGQRLSRASASIHKSGHDPATFFCLLPFVRFVCLCASLSPNAPLSILCPPFAPRTRAFFLAQDPIVHKHAQATSSELVRSFTSVHA